MTDDTYTIDDVLVVLDVVLAAVLVVLDVVAAFAMDITDTISNTRNMLIIADFFFMISPLFTDKQFTGLCNFFSRLPLFFC